MVKNSSEATILSLITVTYNAQSFIESLLKSLKFLPPDTEVIIVDNHSSDQTTEIVQKYPLIKLIKNSQNLGFGTGNNIAAENALGKYLFILNPDTVLLKDTVSKLLECAQKTPGAGIISPKLIEDNGRAQPSIRNLPTFWRAFQEYILKRKNVYEPFSLTGNQPIEVESVYGAAMLIKNDIFKKAGGFNEKYFMYYEDLELCKEVRKLGYKVFYLPNVLINHKVGASASLVPVNRLPWGIRTLAHFIPIRRTGTYYYQVKSTYIFHGLVVGLLIKLLIYLSIKLGVYKSS